MAKITAAPRIQLLVNFEVSEAEARALDALAGYGDDAFVSAFYEKLGEAYMKKHEAGLRQFLKSVRDCVHPAIAQIEDARKVFDADYQQRKDAMHAIGKLPS